MPLFDNLDLSPNQLELVRQRVAATTGYIDLTSSNPTAQGLLFPPDILAAAAATYWPTRRYTPDPRGNPAARDAITRYYAERTPPLALDLDDIFITASTSEAYSLLFALLCEAGDNLLVPSISYPLFEYLAAVQRIELRSYALDPQRGWQLDSLSLLAAMDARTRAILIVSPHNPTGMVIQQPQPALVQAGLPIICDEVFAAMPYGVPNVPPLAALHPTLPIFTLNGISKLFALPDLKLGWIALNAPARATYAAQLELLNDTYLSCSSLIQHMLPTLFAQGMPFVQHMAATVRDNLDWVRSELATCPALPHIPTPDGGYYLFVPVPHARDEEALVLRLLEHGVLVHPGYFYGEPPDSYIMLSALTARPHLEQGVRRLCALLE